MNLFVPCHQSFLYPFPETRLHVHVEIAVDVRGVDWPEIRPVYSDDILFTKGSFAIGVLVPDDLAVSTRGRENIHVTITVYVYSVHGRGSVALQNHLRHKRYCT